MKFTLYTANCTGNEKNTLYSNQKVITSEADLKKAVVYDHVCAQYENFARSDANFLLSDVYLWIVTTTIQMTRKTGSHRKNWQVSSVMLHLQ